MSSSARGSPFQLIRDVRDRGIPIILISHNMPHVFEVSDRIHIQRLGRRVAVVTPKSHSMSEAVTIMTGAMEVHMTPEEMARPAALIQTNQAASA